MAWTEIMRKKNSDEKKKQKKQANARNIILKFLIILIRIQH